MIPNNGKPLFSLTYVHDLVKAIEKSIVDKSDREVYNITTSTKNSIRQILDYTLETLGTTPILVNINSEDLKSNRINEWTDMPLWIDSEYSTFDNQKIMDAYDLQFSSFKDSVKETIQYYDSLEWPTPKYGIDREKQLSLIEKMVN